MARKSIASNAAPMGANDIATPVDAVKFISDYPEYHFLLPVYGDDGKQVSHTDSEGNGKLPTFKDYHFVKVLVKDKVTGKTDPNGCYSFFIASKEHHGKEFDQIVKRLNELRKQPHARMYTEEEHFKRRNPEAFNIAKEKADLEGKLEASQEKIRVLEEKLGLQKR
jgi:hypothetical protein